VRMRKRWIWLALFVITTIGVVTGWNWHTIQPHPLVIETSFERSRTQPLAPNGLGVDGSSADGLPWNGKQRDTENRRPAIAAPTVDSDRLWADLSALAFERHSEADRRLAREYIVRQLRDAGWSPELQPFSAGINVVAERLGTNPAAGKILIGAHYDTVEQSAGADDNATAVAAVLEIARLFGSVPTPRTLQLVLFDEEEVGLLGSIAFAEQLDRDSDLRGAVILEMLGYACYTSGCQQYPVGLPIDPPTDRGDFLAVIGDRGHMPLIHSFERASQPQLPSVVTLPIPLVRFLPPDLLRSDHAPFWQKGIGAVLVTDTANFRTPYYHQPSDTVAAIDRSFFAGAAQLVVNATTTLLNGDSDLATEASNPKQTQIEPEIESQSMTSL